MKIEGLIPDGLWEEIRKVLPPPKPRRKKYPGRKRLDPRRALTGHPLRTEKRHSLGNAAPSTAMRQRDEPLTVLSRLAEGRSVGGHPLIFVEQVTGEHYDRFQRAVIDSSSVRAASGGFKTGPNPTDRSKKGIPLAVHVTEANRRDVTEMLPLVDAIASIGGKRGRPRKRPEVLQSDTLCAIAPA